MNKPADVPSDAEVAEAIEYAHALMDELHEKITESGLEPQLVLFAMWESMTYILAAYGFPADELSCEVHRHAARATSEGRMQ